jgi:hypothetical protein
MTIRTIPIQPVYLSLILVLILGTLTPILNPARAANDLKISRDLPIHSSNVEPMIIPRVPGLRDFINGVMNGKPNDLVGVYVPGVMAFPIVNQPAGNYGYVSKELDEVTLFGLAKKNNTIGLLAHNDMAGKDFIKLLPFMRVMLIYGNGKINSFTITDVKYYHALEPYSPYSNFEDVENFGVWITAEELFNQIYASSNQLVFQTCIAANGESAWGRLFVTAQQNNSIVAGTTNNNGGIGFSAQ